MEQTQPPLTPSEVAARLKVSTETLRRWRDTGAGPAFERLSEKIVRYDAAALEAWREARRGGGD